MAKKRRVNKAQAVRDYLKDHPGAMSREIATALNKQGIDDHARPRLRHQEQGQARPTPPRKRRRQRRQPRQRGTGSRGEAGEARRYDHAGAGQEGRPHGQDARRTPACDRSAGSHQRDGRREEVQGVGGSHDGGGNRRDSGLSASGSRGRVPRSVVPWLKRERQNRLAERSRNGNTETARFAVTCLHGSSGSKNWNRSRRSTGTAMFPPFTRQTLHWAIGCITSARAKRHGTLAEERVRRLDALAFCWERKPVIATAIEAAWKQRINDLKAFKKEHGHCNVPHEYQPNPALGEWVSRTRHRKKRGKLDKEIVRRLNTLGFCWVRLDDLGATYP